VLSSSAFDSIDIVTAAAPVIAAAPASLQFAYTVGGAAPVAQSIQVTNSSGSVLAFTATAATSAGGNWLAVSSNSTNTPATLTVDVNPADLTAGTYSGTVQISAAGASNSPVAVPVTLIVAPAPASLAVAPQSLAFNYTVAGAVPVAQAVSITNAGGGTLSWSATSAGAPWLSLSPASGTAPATLSVSVNPATLAAGTYIASVQIDAAGASGSPVAVAVTLTVQAAQPVVNITSVVNAASFGPGFASATWVAIYGTNLSQITRGWQASDFKNGLLPRSLDGVSVTINGLAAYVEYISPTQVNVLAPDDPTAGAVQVQVTTAQGIGNSLTAQKQQFAPAFFTFGNGKYVAAQHADYSYIGPPGLFPMGAATTPAKPGEIVLLYATGFGPTNPPIPSDQLVTTPEKLANSVQVTIGGVTASVQFAGLTEAGLYQFNVTVPALPDGDAAVVAAIGDAQSQAGVPITVQQ
jgi:uncharacterized protein (TIGR03437 family)